ncbi:ABC transporter permease [Peptacetobacter hiranonis]|uniref:Efflux ABC transporter, permease protein n=1 Tax=Peptacetobacter hiranonis (strain DSM 13275 / JCM 10541 / KCTC 15199 / TO-931) TaxID=500633 RepID=B6G236_PEPHT|nr:ABC transporter permease [Peptacetobacter hiranonis]EEA84180.1 efflux ABC transporter, permease protein [Peptacetobacter hiranonis DSM 13275]QEK19834.1 hypothetical protein KGNDJEFE_00280 [Peptacetobacter hiranonis]
MLHFKLAFQYIKKNLSRSLSIILSISIGIAIILGAGVINENVEKADIEGLRYELGNYHLKIKNIDKETIKNIDKEKNVEYTAIEQPQDGSNYKGQLLNITGINKNYLNISKSKLISGRMPQNTNEIAAEKWVLQNLGLEGEVGEKISLDLNGKKKKETFTVVGIISDRVYEKSIGIMEFFAKVYPNKEVNLYMKVNEDTEEGINSTINNIIKKNSIKKEDVRRNTMLINSIAKSEKYDNKLLILFSIMILFLIFIVYSIYNISIVQRLSEYGMLRAIGGNKSQIFKLTFYELLILSLISLPLGILIGVVGSKAIGVYVCSTIAENSFEIANIVISKNPIIMSLIFIILMIIILCYIVSKKINKIPIIDSINKNNSKNKIKKSIFNLKAGKKLSVEKVIAINNILVNKKTFVVTVISIALGGTMFILSDFVMTLKSEDTRLSLEINTNINSDFKIEQTSVDYSKGISADELKKIEGIDGVKTVEPYKTNYISIYNIDKNKITFPEYFKFVEDFISNKKYEGLMKTESNGRYSSKGSFYGYNNKNLKELDNFLIEGKINIKELNSGNNVILKIPKEGSGHKVVDINVGDKIKIKIPKNMLSSEESIKFPDNIEYIEKELTVSGIVSRIYNQNVYFSREGIDVIASDKVFSEITGVDKYKFVNIDCKEDANIKNIEDELYKITKNNVGCNLRNLSKEVKNLQKNISYKNMILNGMTLILLIMSFFNIFNNISYNLVSRKSEFDTLKAIGLSNKKLKNMVIYEGLVYSIVSSILVVLLSLAGQYLLYYKYFKKILISPTWFINWKLYIVVVIVSIAIGILSTYIPFRIIRNDKK